MTVRDWGLVILLLAFGSVDLRAVRAWRSESALWAQAYRLAPTFPRAATNHAKQLLTAGRDTEARQAILGAR